MATYDAAALLEATRRLQDRPGADLSDIPGVHDGRGEFYAADALGRPLFAGDYVRWRGRALLAAGFVERCGASHQVYSAAGRSVAAVPSCIVLFRSPPWHMLAHGANGNASETMLAEPLDEERRERMLAYLPAEYVAELRQRRQQYAAARLQVALWRQSGVEPGPDGETCGTCQHCQDHRAGPAFCPPAGRFDTYGDKAAMPACQDWLPAYHWFAHSAAERPFREACLAEAVETTPPLPEILTTAALVYADWLDEHGSARRAAAIRHCHRLHQRRQLTDVFRLSPLSNHGSGLKLPQIRSSP